MADKLIDFAVRVMHDYNGLEEKLQNLERNMNVLTYRADDTIKALGEAELHSGRKRKREVEEWLEDVERKKTEFASLKMLAHKARFFARILMARRVDKMIEVIADLVKQSEVFGDFLLDVCETKGMPLVAAEWKGQTFEQDLQEIWAWLMNDEISRIGIYGMGGVGKTTLATRIHNDLLNEATFCGHVYWITASHDASIPKLQNAVAKAINLDISDEDDEKRIAAKLFNALKRRDKFVIIVDDIWSNFDVEKIGIPLGAVGRKLVVTSRSLEVCRRMGCQKEIKVKPLNEEEAWTFFLEKLGCPRELPRDVKEVAKLMARRCHGLPLGIITVAGSMKGVDNIHEWRDALNELQECSLGQDDEVFQILQYSFNCLRDQRLKNCFLYCCLYPEDYKIHGDELIRYFILEGLLDRRSTRQAEFDQGHRILSRLENVCLLESGFGIDGYEETKYVKMHDLIRDMALKVTKTSEPKYMVKAGIELTGIPEENEWKEDLDKVSLMYNELTYVPAAASLNCPKLSTLNLKSNWLTLIPVSFFAQLGAIRVLDLSFNELLEVLPICISNMENLTALLVQCCRRLNFVPPVGKLKALRELDLYETCIENVPEGVGKLVNLKCLDIGNTRVSMIPDGTLSKLSRLQSLKIPKEVEIRAEELELLKHLEEFQGRFSHVDDFNQFVRSCLSCKHPVFYDILLGQDQDATLFSVQNSGHIRITCKRVRILGMETESKIMLPEDIQELELKDCHGLGSCLTEDVFLLLNIQRGGSSLTRCVVKDCEGMKCILKSSSFKNERRPLVRNNSLCPALQNLELLELIKLPSLVELCEWESICGATLPCGTLSCLKSFCIHSCPSMTKLFTLRLLQHLQNLEVINISSCYQLEEIVVDDQEECTTSTSTPSSSNSSSILPKLRKLSLDDLPKLSNFYEGTIFCDSIERVVIRYCPNLKRLPFFFPTVAGQLSPPPTLKVIEILELEREWWESLEWVDAGMQVVLQPFVRFHNRIIIVTPRI